MVLRTPHAAEDHPAERGRAHRALGVPALGRGRAGRRGAVRRAGRPTGGTQPRGAGGAPRDARPAADPLGAAAPGTGVRGPVPLLPIELPPGSTSVPEDV